MTSLEKLFLLKNKYYMKREEVIFLFSKIAFEKLCCEVDSKNFCYEKLQNYHSTVPSLYTFLCNER